MADEHDPAAEPIAADLRGWARGIYALEAATELILRVLGGRFAQPGQAWIKAKTAGTGSTRVACG